MSHRSARKKPTPGGSRDGLPNVSGLLGVLGPDTTASPRSRKADERDERRRAERLARRIKANVRGAQSLLGSGVFDSTLIPIDAVSDIAAASARDPDAALLWRTIGRPLAQFADRENWPCGCITCGRTFRAGERPALLAALNPRGDPNAAGACLFICEECASLDIDALRSRLWDGIGERLGIDCRRLKPEHMPDLATNGRAQ